MTRPLFLLLFGVIGMVLFPPVVRMIVEWMVPL